MNEFSLENHFYDSLQDILQPLEFVKKGKKEYIANVASVFDIEASSFYIEDNKQACMYAWVFGLNGKCIRGRTWEEFESVIDDLVEYYNTNLNKRLIIYVHNLSYEFQWIKHRFTWHKVFSVDSRQPVYAITTKGIEFRCSYLLSGYALKNVGENLIKYKVQKMVGDLDYRLIRHCNTPLTNKEWGYILNDGLVVMAFIQEEIERMGTILDLPMTKTGYVRQLCKENCLKGANRFTYGKMIKQLQLTEDDYNQLKRTYTGGFTHANGMHVGYERQNVSSYDFTSSYPAVMLSEKFPMGPAIPVCITSKEDFINKLNTYCCMFDIAFYEIESKVNYEHYISKARCMECEDYILDNGRVVEAHYLTMSVTEQDFMIIAKMYTWEKITIGNFKIFRKDYLPKDFILTILQLYHDKTTLKGVEGKEAEYMVSKGMINSCYGMTVTDICKDEQLYEEGKDWFTEKADIKTLLYLYNVSSQRFLYYPWGVWITAYARKNLFTGIMEFAEDYIYADTDSIKVLNREKHLKYFEEYNERVLAKIKACLNHYRIPISRAKPKTIKGVEKPLGVWDFEGTYTRFKTLGAKRYMYEVNDKIHITISGVGKSKGVDFLYYKFKTNDKIFKNFKESLEFPAEYQVEKDNGEIEVRQGSGKLTHTYLDDYMCDYVIDYLGNKDIYCEYSGVHMEPTGYNMSIDENFKNYLTGLRCSYIK